ncbi:hypothetical protein NPIL_352171 [Nephila pilipes]|uniref:Uncharacterized protein n=1 Tax=Nephila pilipes TaxID=299642 RepID=A0A8X6PWB0_NEPPI|nr:hypothetical protein NPIL_352171 [Nephila pilipes]
MMWGWLEKHIGVFQLNYYRITSRIIRINPYSKLPQHRVLSPKAILFAYRSPDLFFQTICHEFAPRGDWLTSPKVKLHDRAPADCFLVARIYVIASGEAG